MRDGRQLTELARGLALLAVGTIGALLARAAGVPAGVLIGALLASGIYRLAGGHPGRWRKPFGRVGRLVLGAVIGATFGPDVIEPLKGALGPMLVVIAAIVSIGLALGWALSRLAHLDLATSLLSIMPGGLPAMAAMSESVGADATVVSTIHFVRLTVILLLAPVLVPWLTGSSSAAAVVAATAEPAGLLPTAVALLLAWVGGWLAERAGIPTGDLIGAIVAVAAVNLLGAHIPPLSESLRQGAMLLIGITIGTQISTDSLRRLKRVALPAALALVVIIASGLTLGWILFLVSTLDLATALLSSVPGGAATMPAIAHDLGGDMRLVAALHVTRQLVVFVLVPAILTFILRRARQRSEGQEKGSDEIRPQLAQRPRP